MSPESGSPDPDGGPTGPRRLLVEADGGSRGNPGPAGYGAVVKDAGTGEVLVERAAGIGRATNNVAEYSGLVAGLAAAAELSPAAVEVRMDSKLVIEQMSGRWQIKHPDLKPLARQAAELARTLPSVRYTWVRRERNRYADRLANEAMDAEAAGRSWRPSTPESGRPADRTAGTTRAGRAGPGWVAATSPPTRMLLLRHGQTAYSAERRFLGRADLPLTEQGEEQARASAARMAVQPDVVAVVTSPLLRTRRTAERVAAALGVPLRCDADLVETDFGAWEGHTFAEIQQRWPAELAGWLDSPDVAPPGGESFTAVGRRVRRARDRVIAAHPGRTVVVVSHVTPIKTLLRVALDAPPSTLYRLFLDVASLSIVDWHADGPATVRLVNDTSHLA
ncbi:MAG TPA: bifunctional RNase H/acid phosphatase [Mycobacteriales bacterium]|nr:bifunctional RNase H/acid phosphatase [Mycobacteriales bacterium]